MLLDNILKDIIHLKSFYVLWLEMSPLILFLDTLLDSIIWKYFSSFFFSFEMVLSFVFILSSIENKYSGCIECEVRLYPIS